MQCRIRYYQTSVIPCPHYGVDETNIFDVAEFILEHYGIAYAERLSGRVHYTRYDVEKVGLDCQANHDRPKPSSRKILKLLLLRLWKAANADAIVPEIHVFLGDFLHVQECSSKFIMISLNIFSDSHSNHLYLFLSLSNA
jgi:hypothetical protein